MKTICLILLALAISSIALSQQNEQDEPPTYGGIQTPGFVSANASFTFGASRGSIYLNSLVLEGKSNDYLLPEIDIEVGIVDRLSLELIVGYRKIVSNASLTLSKINKSIKTNKTTDGLNTVMLGANIGLFEEGSIPGMYLENQFYLPKTGNSNFQNEQLGFYSNLNLESTISEITYFDYSLGIGWDGNTPYPAFTLNFNPNFYVTDNILVYGNLSGIYTKDYNPVHFIDIGSTVYITDAFSIDAYFGSELQSKNIIKNSYGALKFSLDFNAFSK